MSSNQKLMHVIANRAVKSVQQTDATMIITFTDDSTMRIKLAGPTNSVMVRDAKQTIEYVD